jgi:hypothetical protein
MKSGFSRSALSLPKSEGKIVRVSDGTPPHSEAWQRKFKMTLLQNLQKFSAFCSPPPLQVVDGMVRLLKNYTRQSAS